jgi:dipeptidyl aminopeptidase/acylaminoacyl peptidase
MSRSISGRCIAWICLLQCGLALSEPPASPQLLPLESFTRYDEFGAIKISPDGEFVALSLGKYGRSAVAFIDLKTKQIISGVRAPEPFEIDDFDWVSPTRLIYRIAERQPDMMQPVPTGEIFAIDRDGRKHKQLYGYRAGEDTTGTHLRKREASYASAELVSILKDDEQNILLAEYPWRLQANYWRHDPDAMTRVVSLNVYSAMKRSLGTAPLREATLLADATDQVRFALGQNDQYKLAVSWKPDPGGPWTAFELQGFREESIEPQRFSTDNHSVFFIAVREEEALPALYRLDLQSKTVEKIHGFADVGVGGIISDFADREVIGVYSAGERRSYHWLQEKHPAAQLYAALLRAFPEQAVRITSTTQDGSRAIVFVSSDTNPGDYYLFDTKTRKADFLRATRVWIDPQLMRPKQPIEVTARDGLKLHGYLTRPAGEGPSPLIVLPHGGPHGYYDTWAFDSEAQLFASRGYAVLQLNFRGSGGYGIEFQAAGYRQWGARMQDDLTDATHWAIEQKITEADRICIFGASYGGYAALMGAVREPDLYRCAVGYAGIYDLELMLTSADIPDSRSGRAYLHKALGTDVADLRSRSPAYNAERIQVPVLLIHGKEDWRADYEQAKRMKSALEKSSKPVELMTLSREGHGAYDEQTRKQVYERILAFLDQHLKK